MDEKIWHEAREGVEAGLNVRKMNVDSGTGDTEGQTLKDSVPVGSDSNLGF